MFPGYTVLKFEEIRGGAAGEAEARAAEQWLDTGALVQEPPAGLVARDESGGYDTRVIDKDTNKRRRRLSSETVVGAQQPKHSKRPASGKAGAGGKPKKKQKAASKQGQWEGDLYSRAAYLSHGDGIGALSRRRARGPRPLSSRAGDLPPGFRLVVKTLGGGGGKYRVIQHQSSGRTFPTAALAQAFWEELEGGGAGPGSAAAAVAGGADVDAGLPPGWAMAWAHAGEAEDGASHRVPAFVSPEGLVFDAWEEAEAWLEAGHRQCPPPSQLLAALRGAAASGRFAPPAKQAKHAALVRLGLQRVRVALFKEERERALRMAGAAGAAAGGSTPAGGTGRQQQKRAQGTAAAAAVAAAAGAAPTEPALLVAAADAAQHQGVAAVEGRQQQQQAQAQQRQAQAQQQQPAHEGSQQPQGQQQQQQPDEGVIDLVVGEEQGAAPAQQPGGSDVIDLTDL